MLYRLLDRQAPDRGKSLANLLTKVRQGDFASPRMTDRRVPRPLEAICLKAMTLANRKAGTSRSVSSPTTWNAGSRTSRSPATESHPSPGSAAGHGGTSRWSPARVGVARHGGSRPLGRRGARRSRAGPQGSPAAAGRGQLRQGPRRRRADAGGRGRRRARGRPADGPGPEDACWKKHSATTSTS